jgi:serine/threonine protein kinase
MVGTAKNNQTIYIIDFGLAKPYMCQNTGSHIERKSGKSLVGTAKFASIASHEGYGKTCVMIEQCRRDDLESLAYLLIYFAQGGLPWQGVKDKVKAVKYSKIGEMKKSISPEALCKDLPEEFLYFLKTVRNIKFTEKPNYE